jgi:hypothetical protein
MVKNVLEKELRCARYRSQGERTHFRNHRKFTVAGAQSSGGE